MTSEDETTNIVKPFSQIRNKLGNSHQSNYLYDYLSSLKAITCVIEDNYIDKDYLIDYSKFYARSFQNINKFTIRLHFFSESFTNEDFSILLSNGDRTIYEKLDNSYLGFIVVKPIKNIRGEALIGRSILKTYPSEVNDDENRYYIKEIHRVYLFGIPLEVESLPFQTQDTAVGACATTACWTTLHPLKTLFGITKDSPFEITEKSVSFPSMEERNFPNNGLTLLQMKSYFNSINLETEFIDIKSIENLKDYSKDDDVVADAVKAYTNMKLPIIAALMLMKEGEINDLHAAVISGFRHKNGVINELYVHDDRIGPYCKTLPKENFRRWENEWIYVHGFTDVLIYKLMIPIYPKIRLSFNSIYQIYLDHKRKLEIRSEGLIPDLYLIEAKKYKNYLCKYCNFEDKEKILRKPFPRFLWIIRLHYHGIPIIDYIHDATSVYPKERNLTFKY